MNGEEEGQGQQEKEGRRDRKRRRTATNGGAGEGEEEEKGKEDEKNHQWSRGEEGRVEEEENHQWKKMEESRRKRRSIRRREGGGSLQQLDAVTQPADGRSSTSSRCHTPPLFQLHEFMPLPILLDWSGRLVSTRTDPITPLQYMNY